MTNIERILALIRSSVRGLTDREIGEQTGITPHQQVNQICNKLATRRLTRREHGPEGFLINRAVVEGDAELSSQLDAADRSGTSATPATTRPPAEKESPVGEFVIPDLRRTLVVIPCSKSKRQGGVEGELGSVSIMDFLPDGLAKELRAVREANLRVCQVDESWQMAAVKRYCGAMYRAAGTTLEQLDGAGAAVAVISGGYGVVLVREEIGRYEQKFDAAMWPNQLVGRCLSAYAKSIGARTVVGLFGATTSYARAFRRAQWPPSVQNVWLLCPAARWRDGSQVKVPRAIGEALAAIGSTGTVAAGWTSSDDLRIRIYRISGAGG